MSRYVPSVRYAFSVTTLGALVLTTSVYCTTTPAIAQRSGWAQITCSQGQALRGWWFCLGNFIPTSFGTLGTGLGNLCGDELYQPPLGVGVYYFDITACPPARPSATDVLPWPVGRDGRDVEGAVTCFTNLVGSGPALGRNLPPGEGPGVDGTCTGIYLGIRYLLRSERHRFDGRQRGREGGGGGV